jgi:ferric-dicitrate binding protein FerR (iron transport regulator)
MRVREWMNDAGCANLKPKSGTRRRSTSMEDHTMTPRANRAAVFATAFATAAAIGALVVANSAHAATDTTDIGTATSITTNVTASGGGAAPKIVLRSGDAVFQNQTISTDENGIGQFQFRDQTKLAVGPGSVIVLDNFVYESATSKAKVVMHLTSGALRFITGKSEHDAYEIVTPAATIGVRGTAFDAYTTPEGELAIAMINGAVEVCPRGGSCRLHNIIGQFLHMTPAGIFSLRNAWDGSFLTGVPFKLALPFMSDQKLLLPALRGQSATIRRYVSTTGKDLGKVVKLPLTKLPKIKLPKLFK